MGKDMTPSQHTPRSIAQLLFACMASAWTHAQAWEPVGPGMPSAVYALEAFDGHLYAGGTFTLSGTPNSYYLARWDGTAWGNTGGLISYMAADGLYSNDTALFIGDGGRVRLWNGTTWSNLTGTTSSSFNSTAYSMAHLNDTLYVGGFFSSPFAHVAKWNGTAYEDLAGGCNAQVSCLMPLDGSLFAGGNFTMAGGDPASRTARWTGSAWEAMGSGVNDDVFTHCMFRDTLYIGGRFTQANGLPASRVAKWNGSQWVRVGGTLNDYVTAMAVYRDQLYIGGAFTIPSRVARLQGNAWVPVGGGVDNTVRTMEVFHDSLFIGGSFTTAGGLPIERIAKMYVVAAPVADFGIDDPALCPADCASFTDLSSNAIDRAWSFPGGEPATSSDPSPTVCYSTPGTYDVSLVVSNSTGFHATTHEAAITVEVCMGSDGVRVPAKVPILPNPFHDHLHLFLSGTGPHTITVHDGKGAHITTRHTAPGPADIDATTWPPGLYLITITTADGTHRLRTMKN